MSKDFKTINYKTNSLPNSDSKQRKVYSTRSKTKTTNSPDVIDTIINRCPNISNILNQSEIRTDLNTEINTEFNHKSNNSNNTDTDHYVNKNNKRKANEDLMNKRLTKKKKIIISDDDEDDNIANNYDEDYDIDEFEMDFPDEFKNMNRIDRDKLSKKIMSLHKDYEDRSVTLKKVIDMNLTSNDTQWFYKNIRRVNDLEGTEKFSLQDKIEKRYILLKYLVSVGKYGSYNKDPERDVIKDIVKSNHSDRIKQILLNRIYNVTDDSIEEYNKTLTWIDTVLSIPTEVKASNIKTSKSDIKTIIKNLHYKLSTNMHCMESTIQNIMQAVCAIMTDPSNKGYILALVGPPGVGKTTISSLISEAIGMGFGQISCGSINDQATIIGHSSTYIGSKPGIFTQIQINTKQLDNVILLDEMDKIHDPKIIPVLLHVLDKTQNNRFKDAYCPEIEIDLSKNLYIVAVNNLDNFDSALIDRLKVINVNGYNIDQKIEICSKHIIPKIMLRTGIMANIGLDIIRRIVIKISPNISGVRDLERFFSDIYEKLLLVKNSDINFFNLPSDIDIDKITSITKPIVNKLTDIKI